MEQKMEIRANELSQGDWIYVGLELIRFDSLEDVDADNVKINFSWQDDWDSYTPDSVVGRRTDPVIVSRVVDSTENVL